MNLVKRHSIVVDQGLTTAEVDDLIARYELQIRDCLKIIKSHDGIGIESQIALRAIGAAKAHISVLRAA